MTPTPLPAGLLFHCDKCGLVVPSDAPNAPSADCAFIALHKLAWFNPNESLAGQHVQAVATWALIHDAPLKAGEAATTTYAKSYRASRKDHFVSSAVRRAMTPEQIQAGLQHKRDAALYE